jgi:hypothetical protein
LAVKTLTSASDVYSTTASQCIVAQAGSDTVMASGSVPMAAIGGAGDDTMYGGSAMSVLHGGPGRDTLFGFGGVTEFFGGAGEDTIFAGNGNSCVIPGPGADVVNLGVDHDTVRINHVCEVAAGEQLVAGTGVDTLITPIPVASLQALGVTVQGFERVVVESHACASECVTQPICGVHGHCIEGPSVGTTACGCDPGFEGPTCSIVSPTVELDHGDELGDLQAQLVHSSPNTRIDGEVNFAVATSIAIPDKLSVLRGNAGNGSARLTIEDPAGKKITCTYRGGASSAHPVTALEIAKGSSYKLQSCEGEAGVDRCFESHLGAQGVHPAKRVTLRIDSGDALHAAGVTEIGKFLTHGDTDGDGNDESCGEIEALLDAEKTAQMRENFSWPATTSVAEFDADAEPTLWYAAIYIRSQEELEALDEARIHYDQFPIFDEELEAFDGKCGVVNNAGDGKGVFVYALLTGQTYNLIRWYALNPDPTPVDPGAADRTLFQAVVLRDIPVGARNSVGSVDLNVLKDAKFYFRNLRVYEDLAPESPDYGLFEKLARKIGEAVQNGVRKLTNALGSIDRFINGSVNFSIDMSFGATDPGFYDEDDAPIMTQAWGEHVGEEINTGGLMTVRMRYEGLAGLRSFLPTTYDQQLGNDNIANIEVAKDGNMRNRAFCLRYQSDDVTITHGILPAYYCDFGDVGVSAGADRTIELPIRNAESNVFVQANDGAKYLRRVVDYTPHRARILMGKAASGLAVGTKVAWAPCFDFPNATRASVIELASFVASKYPPLALAGAATALVDGIDWVSSVDIIVPRNDRSSRSRSTATHEYGHYALCSLAYDVGKDVTDERFPLISLSKLTFAQMMSGTTIERDEEPRFLNESFADLFASQVIGGVEYASEMNGTSTRQNSATYGAAYYCVDDPSELPNDPGDNMCFDRNKVFLGDGDNWNQGEQFSAQIALWHDALDGHGERGHDLPASGSFWNFDNDEFTPTNRAAGDLGDESVALDGTFFRRWIGHWQSRSTKLEREPFERAWLAAMSDETTWCERCEILCIHDQDCEPETHVRDRWEACRSDRFGRHLGEAPDEYLRLNAANCRVCPDDTISTADGDCEGCPPGHAADENECVPCEPEASTPDELEDKGACGYYEHQAIVDGGGQGCAKRTVIELIGLQDPATPQDVIVTASYQLAKPTGLTKATDEAKAWQLACAASSARLVVYIDDDTSDDELDLLLADETEVGVADCDVATGICNDPECRVKAQFKIPPDPMAPADRRFRIIADALAGRIEIPTDASVGPQTNPYPVGCTGGGDGSDNCCGNNKPCKEFEATKTEQDIRVYTAAREMIQASHEVYVRVHAGICTDPNLPPD